MLIFLALMMATPAAPPPDELRGQLYAAIWDDLYLNAMIGNGNWIASLWYHAGRADPETPDLHIRDLRCRSRDGGHRCSFALLRDGGIGRVFNEEAPDRLTCRADFGRVVAEEGGRWAVRHLPPDPAGGHSRTTMRCERSPPA